MIRTAAIVSKALSVKAEHAGVNFMCVREKTSVERWVSKETVYSGKIIVLRTGTVRLDDGLEAFREVVEHPGGVGVLPCFADSVLLVRQYRIAVGKELLEIPAGKLEGNETPEHRGRVELEEEAGFRAGKMTSLGHFYPSCGILAEKLHLFLATELERTEQRLETDERIECVRLSHEEVRRRLDAHEFEDGKTIIALHAMFARAARGD